MSVYPGEFVKEAERLTVVRSLVRLLSCHRKQEPLTRGGLSAR